MVHRYVPPDQLMFLYIQFVRYYWGLWVKEVTFADFNILDLVISTQSELVRCVFWNPFRNVIIVLLSLSTFCSVIYQVANASSTTVCILWNKEDYTRISDSI